MLTGTCSGCQGGADAPGVERRVFKRLKVWRVLRGGLVVLRHSPSTLSNAVSLFRRLNATLIIIEFFKKSTRLFQVLPELLSHGEPAQERWGCAAQR